MLTHSQLALKRQAFWEGQTSGRRLIWDNLKVSEKERGREGEGERTTMTAKSCKATAGNYIDSLSSSSLTKRFNPPCNPLSSGCVYERMNMTSTTTTPVTSTTTCRQVVSEAMIQHNIELANTLLDAADIRVPHGDLSVAYDSLGQLYQVPRYAYSTPSNVMTEEEANAVAQKSRKAHHGPVEDIPLVIRISASTNTQEQDIKMTLRSDTTVGEMKAMLSKLLASGAHDQALEPSNTKPNKWTGKGLPVHRQRIMYRGREIPDSNHMQELGVSAGSYLQIFVRPE